MSKVNFKDVWKFPLVADSYGIYAFSANGTMALTFGSRDAETRKDVVACINGEVESTTKGRWTMTGTKFYLDGEFQFMVRGWGHLIGTGGLHLDSDDAMETQDDFINYIFERLNG